MEDDNLSITRSISVAQTDIRAGKSELLCRLLLLWKHCETGQGKTNIFCNGLLITQEYVQSCIVLNIQVF